VIQKRSILTNATSLVVQIAISSVVLFVLYKFLLEMIGVAQMGIWFVILATSSMVKLPITV
jgi:TRAP-type uncharacterized transport system fused permease subunit